MSSSLIINTTNNITDINTTKIEMYSTTMCPYCTMAKSLLEKKGSEYIDKRVDNNAALRAEMEQRSNRTSVPQIFIAGRHIGGFDDLVELDMDGELDEMLGIATK